MSTPSRPVAIIGIACTYPGARNAREFWQNIVNKVDAITEVTPDRWDPRIFYDPDPNVEDRIYCKKGGWIGGAYSFNPLEFGIMPSALEGTEADHFLVLRTAHEALSDAGYAGKKLDGERVGIILGKGNYTGPGVTALMYRSIVTEQVLAILKGIHPEFTDADIDRLKAAVRATLPRLTPEGAAGLIPNICTGRVANRLDFMGRNLTVDAACASSLIAAELACHDLNEGRADLVLAGGVHIFAHIPFLHVFDTMRALSFSSTIRPFDQDCDGTMSGEGVGVLVLKRLPDAERDGDRIYAVIRGTGNASDGRAKGIVAPRPEGEELAMRRAYEASAISPASVELIEAHGTATPAGDAAEAEALRRVFGPSDQGRPTCAVGSVKSMIGHAMPAAGAASLIKAALALHHRVLPPTLNVRKPRAGLVEGDSRFYVNTEMRPWIRARGASPRRAGVSAFGFGGINAHIVLEEYTGPSAQAPDPRPPVPDPPTFLREWPAEFVVLEAESRIALIQAAQNLRSYAIRVQGVDVRDLAFTLNSGLRNLPYRLAVVAESLEDLTRKLEQAEIRLREPGILKDRQGLYSFSGSEICGKKLAVLFPGEGAQYVNMLGDLCVHFPEVRTAFDMADAGNTRPGRAPASALIFPPPPFSEDEAAAAENRLWEIDRATEAVLTADTAVFRLFERLGLRADMMTGHSAGEWIALAAAGVFDSTEFFASMDRLSRMYESIAANTEIPRMSMLAVAAGREKVEKLVREIGCDVHVANDNCFHQVVIVVDPADESSAIAQLRQNGIFVEKLPYDRGYHTPAFTYICAPLRQFFSGMAISRPRVTLYSCSGGDPYPEDASAILDVVSNTFARPLLFRQTIERMYEEGARIFIESGPRGNLTAFVDDILRGKPHLAVSADQFRRPGLATLNHALAMLAAAHVPMDFAPLYERRTPRRLTLDPQADSVTPEDRRPGTVQVSLCYPRLGVPEPLPEPVGKSPGLSPWPPAPDPWPVPADANGTSSAIAGLLDEHVAVMEEFLRTHEAVMRGAFTPPVSPQSAAQAATAVALAPARPDVAALLQIQPLIRGSEIVEYTPEQSIELRAVLDPKEHLFLQDHCLYFEASEHGNQGTRLLSMPMTGSLEMMAEAAALLCPGLRVVEIKRVQALRWINVKEDERTFLSITAQRTGERKIHAAIRPESSGDARKEPVAEATIVFATAFPATPPADDFALRNPREPVFTAKTIYSEHLMFHGPSFQGIATLDRVGENGVLGSLKVLPDHSVLRSDTGARFHFDPFLLDAAGQMVGYWPVEYLSEGFVCLPIRIANITLFRENLTPESLCACRVKIAELSHRQLRGDFDALAPDGQLWMRVQGWEDWRFYWERHIHEFWRFPNRGHNGRPIAIPGLENSDVVCVRIDPLSEIDKTGLWEVLWMNMILNRRELEEHSSITDPAARAEWMFQRAAAKDAVRAWLKRNRSVDVYPADVNLDSLDAPYVSVCYSGQSGIAAASARPISVCVSRTGLLACPGGAYSTRDGDLDISITLLEEPCRVGLRPARPNQTGGRPEAYPTLTEESQ